MALKRRRLKITRSNSIDSKEVSSNYEGSDSYADDKEDQVDHHSGTKSYGDESDRSPVHSEPAHRYSDCDAADFETHRCNPCIDDDDDDDDDDTIHLDVYFHGFLVASRYRHYLERIYRKEGEFWSTCCFKTKEFISAVLQVLGKALMIADAPCSDIPKEKLEEMLTYMDDVMKAGLRLGCLTSCTSKARAIIFVQAEKAQVNERLDAIKQELVTLELEKQKLQRRLDTLELDSRWRPGSSLLDDILE